MNASLRKELRLLWSSFPIGLLAAFSVWLLPRNAHASEFWTALRFAAPFVFCPAMIVMLALDSFGREVGSGTFTQLLAQPISRTSVWCTKVLLLVGAAMVIWVIWLGSLLTLQSIPVLKFTSSEWLYFEFGSLLFVFVALSGGLWTVLLFRQVGIAFWFTLLSPLTICVVTLMVLGEKWAAPINT